MIPLLKKGTASPGFFIWDNGKLHRINVRGLYANSAAFIVSNGPSFADVNHDLLRQPGILTMGFNNGPKVFRPDLWLFTDGAARFLESVFRDPQILKFTSLGRTNRTPKEDDKEWAEHPYKFKLIDGKIHERIWDTKRWAEDGWPYPRNKDEAKISERYSYFTDMVVEDSPNLVFFDLTSKFEPDRWLTESSINNGNHRDRGGGRSVMMAALKILYVLGIRRVYFVGVDWFMSTDRTYSFDEQREQFAIDSNNASYCRMISYWTELLPYWKRAGFEVKNCTKGSCLTLFPYTDLEEAIALETKDIPSDEEESTKGRYVHGR